MNDRITGYFLMLLLAAIILIPLFFFIKEESAPSQIRTIEFKKVNTVSFLFKQDAVRIQGAQVGTVKDIKTSYDKVLVTIEIRKPFLLYSNYTITAYLKGLMGERFINIHQGDNSAPMANATDTLKGTFLEGPAEIIAYANQLKSLIEQVNSFVLVLKDGDAEKKSFVKQFADVYKKVDTLSSAVNTVAKNMDQLVSKNRDSLESLLSIAIAVTDTLSTELPAFLNKINKTISTTSSFVSKVDTLMNTADTIVAAIENPDAFIWKDDIAKLQTDLKALREILKDIRTDGLHVPARL